MVENTINEFNRLCGLFEKCNQLYSDEDFEIADEPETKDQKLYNEVVDNLDLLYGHILVLGREIAKNPSSFGMTPSDLEVKVHNAGIFKQDIDFDKEFNEEMAGEQLYPKAEYIEPLVGDDLGVYLFGNKQPQ